MNKLGTPEEARAWLDYQGITISQWAPGSYASAYERTLDDLRLRATEATPKF